MLRTKSILLATSGVFLGGLLLLLNSSLALATDLLVSPANSYIQVDGGEERWLDYELKNDSQQNLAISLDAVSFIPDEDYGQPILQPELLFPYFSLHESSSEATLSVILPANSQKKVQIRVAPPLGIEKKEYPTTLFFVAEPEIKSESSNTQVSFRLGSNLIVQTDKSNLDKSQLTLEAPKLGGMVDSFVLPKQQVKIVNQGASGTLIQGQLRLRRKSGELVQSWDFYPDLVLGKSSRLARGKTEPDGNGNVSLITEFKLPKPLIGEYVLEGEVTSAFPGTTQTPTSFQLEFLALPYWLLLIVLGIIVLIVMMTVMSRKSAAKKNLQRRSAKMKAQKSYFDN